MQQDAKAYLGTGLHFPLRVNPRGEIMLVSGAEDIEQAILIILGTRPGERVMRPTFGCRAYELIFEPNTSATISQLREYVHEALRMWEPRIEVRSINISVDSAHDGALLTKVEYEIKATHDVRSIVYPFFIEAEQEI